ncbi:ABC-three component system protein [Acinetobacter pittii]|uniref:ABC-three component system protein n=1 Tax=Acinetobacter pittii TaxID=48296 RepID=UPI000838CF33|nr:ABC-three component system protein [Acinetobacter pittii]OCZ19553.1 hypothetical protein BFR96_08085 [Acinetobacter pittii]
MAFDASPSWSGFNYQGKVALYYALKRINMLPIEEDFSNSSLMLEANEDFEIIINGVSVSFHQVKAYDKSSYSKYSNALLEITLELSKNPKVIGKIHTWKKINPKPEFSDIKSSITSDIKEILDEYREANNANNTNSTLHKAVSNTSNISKKTSIIRNAFKNKTLTEIAQSLLEIFNNENDAISRVEIYTYDDGNQFCDLNSINDKIKSELSVAFTKREILVTSDQLDKSFLYFLGIMDKYIINRHKNKRDTQKLPILFAEIIEVLEKDHEDISKEYLAHKFKERFAYHIDHYMEDPGEEYIQPESGAYCNLQEARKLLLGLNPYELWDYYRHFSPQICFSHDGNLNNAFESNPDGIRYVLIRILHDIDFKLAFHNQATHKLTYRQASPPYQHYLPTTITHVARIIQIERQITSNPSINEILYEIENLIYNGTAHHTFSPLSTMHTEAPIEDESDDRPKRDEALKVIKLIPLLTAKDQLA